jgi:hypothetical protein
MCYWDCNKGINNPNGVFSGVTRTTGGQNWSSDRNILQYVYGSLYDTVSISGYYSLKW